MDMGPIGWTQPDPTSLLNGPTQPNIFRINKVHPTQPKAAILSVISRCHKGTQRVLILSHAELIGLISLKVLQAAQMSGSRLAAETKSYDPVVYIMCRLSTVKLQFVIWTRPNQAH